MVQMLLVCQLLKFMFYSSQLATIANFSLTLVRVKSILKSLNLFQNDLLNLF